MLPLPCRKEPVSETVVNIVDAVGPEDLEACFMNPPRDQREGIQPSLAEHEHIGLPVDRLSGLELHRLLQVAALLCNARVVIVKGCRSSTVEDRVHLGVEGG